MSHLASIIRQENAAILANWRGQVRLLPSARNLDQTALNDHIPGLLLELATALEESSKQTIPEALAEGTAPIHGKQRLADGFDIVEVVAEYNVLRGCIHRLADEHHITLHGGPLHIINRVFDQSIGLAVQTFAEESALEVQRRREDYLAFIAHDLGTPLSAIALAEKVLHQTLKTDGIAEQSAQMLSVLRRGVAQLEQLVTQVLQENTHLDAEIGLKLVRRKFYLWPFIEILIHDLDPHRDRLFRLANQVPEALQVYADANLLRRVFQNLLTNAIKYCPSGEIHIGAETNEADGVVECWVRDLGAGIPPDRIDQVFNTGEADPGDSGGTGLGLAIVKTITEAHGGQVSVSSQIGLGSTFQFTLPTQAKS
jgi:two-component system, OmpR family, phosphate regulon sensor histidine kinase PhoR